MIDKIFNTIPIKGNFCHLYPVEISDAKFIYDLRTQEGGAFLKKIGPTVNDQKLYLKKYMNNYTLKKEIYFKLLDCKTNKFVGVTRFCELDTETKFGFESGIMLKNCAPNIYLDAMFIIFKIGFDLLGRQVSGPWYVDNRNTRMINFHQKIGIAKLVKKEKFFTIFEANSKDYFSKVSRYEKLNLGIINNLNLNE